MDYWKASFNRDLPVDIEKIIFKYYFDIQDMMTPDDINQMLNEADFNQMLIDVKTLENEIVQKCLENYILNDYTHKFKLKTFYKRNSTCKSKRSSVFLTLHSSMASIYKDEGIKDSNLNFQKRNELARKLVIHKGRHIDHINRSTKEDVKHVQGLIEELKCRYKDAIELEKNFNLKFYSHEFDLDAVTDNYLREKFYKFTNDSLKSSQVYIMRMKFIIKALKSDSLKLRNEFDMKNSHYGLLKPIDFILLAQNYGILKRDFDEILVKLAGIKSSAGLAYLILNDMKKRIIKLESNIKYLTDRDERGCRCLKRLVKEATTVESRYIENCSTLATLKEKFQTYIAPSVNQYAELKEELVTLEKEEKILQRQIAIANIKFKNLKVKQTSLK